MGSAEDFTPLSQITYGMNNCRVRVRISRLWQSFNPKNDILFGLDSLLIDDQGETIQARVLPGDIEQFEGRLVEGKVYALSDFTVEDTRESYMSCSNELTMYFRHQTVVSELEGDIDLIPLHSFEFIDFKDLRSRCEDTSLLTDVLGHIVYVGELEEFSKKSRVIEICNARIRNLRGRELNITLYGDIACDFAEDMLEKGQEASVVAVFAGVRVESSYSVCSTTSSMYYLDLEIPEVQEFCANLRIQQENPVPKKSPAQKLAESWQTIEQIKNLDPKEYDEDSKFLCRVSLIDIDCSDGWCYLGCDVCRKSMYNAPRKYKCSRCGPIKRPINWYKLKTTVQDATGTMDLMIFCEVAEELVGVSAEELVDEIEEDDEWYTLPDEIEDLIGSTHTFQVYDKHGTRSFSVYSIMDNVSVPAPAATTTQCKEESVPKGSSNVPVPCPTTTQCIGTWLIDSHACSLRIQEENPVPKKSPAQKLAESWRTIEQIKNLDPKEYDEDSKFLCRVSLIDIDCSDGWCYLGCDVCRKSMYNAPRKYKCSRCGPIKRPINWYAAIAILVLNLYLLLDS